MHYEIQCITIKIKNNIFPPKKAKTFTISPIVFILKTNVLFHNIDTVIN